MYGARNNIYLVTAYGGVLNSSSGTLDQENIDLIESGINSRIFTGTVGLSLDPLSNYGLLYVNSGPPSTTASFIYTDLTGGSRRASSRLQYSGVVSVSFPSQGGSAISLGDTINITVTDGDADLNLLQIGTVQVTVSSVLDYTEILTLLEVSSNAGVFTGAMITQLGPAKLNQRIDLQMPPSSPSSSIILTVSNPPCPHQGQIQA